jgi:phosphatidylglycerol:prolipoprotein diacylglycerol transferase
MHPVLFRLGPVDIPGYGAMAALGIVAATLLAALLARRDGIGVDFVLDAVFWTLLAGFAGARAAYMVVSWHETVADPLGALLNSGGGIYLGGLAAGGAALVAVCRGHGVAVARAADLLAPAVALAHAFGRVGCHLAGCCYGRVAADAMRWCAVQYPEITNARGQAAGSWPYLDHLSRHLIEPGAPCSLPVYPVQLMEAGLNLALCAALVVAWRHPHRAGSVAVAYLLAYSAGRFALEFLRGDTERGILAGFSLSQWLSLAAAAAALWLLRCARRDGTPAG